MRLRQCRKIQLQVVFHTMDVRTDGGLGEVATLQLLNHELT
jgi:hypothetical protein